MRQLPLDPRLQLQGGQLDLQRLNDWMRDVAKVTRELQTPPMLSVSRTAAAQNLTGGGGNEVINFDTVAVDTHSGWDSTNYRYKYPRTGYYRIKSRIGIATTLASDATGYINAFLRSNLNGTLANSYVWHQTLGKQEMLYLDALVFGQGTDSPTASDYLDVYVVETPTGYVVDNANFRTALYVKFLGSAPLR